MQNSILPTDTSLHVLPPSLRAAQLFATPIPAEYEAQGAKIQKAVEQAVRESVEQGVDKKGKEVTPWLLKRVGELTQGKALESSESALSVLSRYFWVAADDIGSNRYCVDREQCQGRGQVGSRAVAPEVERRRWLIIKRQPRLIFCPLY